MEGVYVGEFKDNMADGHGILMSSRGIVYIGQFKDGNVIGDGHLIFTNRGSDKTDNVVKLKDIPNNMAGTDYFVVMDIVLFVATLIMFCVMFFKCMACFV
ncbi:MAG: hypothetical protein HQL61_05265 [Magnetococcales bacterium]|nr:hypothetical protein [Nitrospirota bacterium]